MFLIIAPRLLVFALDGQELYHNIHRLTYSAGDVLNVVGFYNDGLPVLACVGRLAVVGWVNYWHLFRIPVWQEKPDLEYLNNGAPILWYGEWCCHTPSINSFCPARQRLISFCLLFFSSVRALEDHQDSSDAYLPFHAGDIIAVLAKSRPSSVRWNDIKWEEEWEWREYQHPRGEAHKEYWWLGTHLKESSRISGKLTFDPAYVKCISREEAHAAISTDMQRSV